MTRERDRDVFLKCPFDSLYKPLFEALIFVIHDCGYRVRSALEIDDAGINRLPKIAKLIASTDYGIHDLSRMELDPTTGFPRFNMPFELGMAVGMRSVRKSERPVLVVVEAESRRYRDSCSDLAGIDIKDHGNEIRTLVGRVREWLRNQTPTT